MRNITAELQAGFGAGNVIEADAVGVADADIFHRLRLSEHHRIRRAGAGDCHEHRDRSENKALKCIPTSTFNPIWKEVTIFPATLSGAVGLQPQQQPLVVMK